MFFLEKSSKKIPPDNHKKLFFRGCGKGTGKNFSDTINALRSDIKGGSEDLLIALFFKDGKHIAAAAAERSLCASHGQGVSH